MALLVAAITALALVPAGAYGTAVNSGHFGTDASPTNGKITVSGVEDGETYTLYKIFDLASFSDASKEAGAHADDHYSYVIKEGSAWLSFIKNYEDTSGAKAFAVDEANPVTFGEYGLSGNYYVVTVNGNAFGAPAGNTPDPTYDEDQQAEYMDSSAEVQAFAKAALAHAKGTTAIATDTTGAYKIGEKTAEPNAASLTWDNLGMGWYLVGTSLGSLVALDTTNNEVTMYEKNLKPTIDKKVKASGQASAQRDASSDNDYPASTWVSNTSYNIGDEVTFLTTITAKKNGEGYVLHDVMEQGFSFNNANPAGKIRVYAKTGTSTSYALVPATTGESPSVVTNYTVTTNTSSGQARLADKCNFEISFADSFIASLNFDSNYQSVIQVEYDATLDSDAIVVGNQETGDATSTNIGILENGTDAASQLTGVESNADGRNTNSTILTFGAGSSTEWKSATVETYQFDVVKAADRNSNSDPYSLLAGAKFELYADDAVDSTGTKPVVRTGGSYGPIALIGDTAANKIFRKKLAGESGTAVTQFETDAEHAITFKGLKAGTYWLREVAAPSGYNKLSDLIKVTVKDQSAVTATNGTVPALISIDYSGNNSSSDVTDGQAKATVAVNSNQGTYDPTVTPQGGVLVINKTGPELPSTGGIGTTVFYVVGGILVAGSVVLLITKRRMASES